MEIIEYVFNLGVRVLKSNNQDVIFVNIREVSEDGQWYMNNFIKYPKNNTRVNLELW